MLWGRFPHGSARPMAPWGWGITVWGRRLHPASGRKPFHFIRRGWLLLCNSSSPNSASFSLMFPVFSLGDSSRLSLQPSVAFQKECFFPKTHIVSTHSPDGEQAQKFGRGSLSHVSACASLCELLGLFLSPWDKGRVPAHPQQGAEHMGCLRPAPPCTSLHESLRRPWINAGFAFTLPFGKASPETLKIVWVPSSISYWKLY